MFKWFKRKPVIKNRSSKNGDYITKDESNFMIYRISHNLPFCPDCESGVFLEGPQGGLSKNMLCNNCFSEFNIFHMSQNQICGERISDAKGCCVDRLKQIYGMPF
jgi:hypothetical protein